MDAQEKRSLDRYLTTPPEEPVINYECSKCGSEFTSNDSDSNQCPECGCFARVVEDFDDDDDDEETEEL